MLVSSWCGWGTDPYGGGFRTCPLSCYNSLSSHPEPMSIYSQCSDLTTRETMWVARPSDLAPQRSYAGQISTAEGWWWAGCHAERYASDVVGPQLD